jgi:hypothetical protein
MSDSTKILPGTALLLIVGRHSDIAGMLTAVPATAVLQMLLGSLDEFYRNSEFCREG